MTLLSVKNLSKTYVQYRSELHRIASWFGWRNAPVTTIPVLQDISFDISQGESVGIIGQNGAGKSTLLKLIVGTLQKTSGDINQYGRISAILELGMGFNPDLTGRQNVRHAAGLMGFHPNEIETMLPDIEDFAEIGDKFDAPVRTYSTGMQMRVAFAVATAVRPDLLIIDEALSVGDSYFQHKSFDRIKDFTRRGTSLLIVSHDINAVLSLCNRAILLDNGKLLRDGEPEMIMDYYNAIIAKKERSKLQVTQVADGRQQIISGTGEVRIEKVRLCGEDGADISNVPIGEQVTLEVATYVEQAVDELVVGYMIKDRLGQQVFGTNTHYLKATLHDLKPGDTPIIRFTFEANMGAGSYAVTVALHSSENHLNDNYEWRDMALVFSVISLQKLTFFGYNWLPPTVTTTTDKSA
ncbi:ATP binding component of ABC-transporter [Methylophaga frappieri]|uniref:ATP binding component of ABC-transporter n=1 Tax=Methylophaga frappieri (strain ATCC BAA-2434 / DSM 25690 / JAM7) TaxID=754477 RepID=I1YKI7_METFJ|nr:ABC transporter ATP-binding protein [Methylophaga frappieri]AFJ03430.1 ATP binding component of ABC-transporter [Methylophaga frappieri]